MPLPGMTEPDLYSSKPPRRIRNGGACIRCRKSRRRCNGQKPCSTCKRYNYECNFELTSRPVEVVRKREEHVPTNTLHSDSRGKSNSGRRPVLAITQVGIELPSRESDDEGGERLREELADALSSSTSFQRLVGMMNYAKISQFPTPAFNIGLAGAPYRTSGASSELYSVISIEEMQMYSKVYFETVNPIYGLVDRDQFETFVAFEYNNSGPVTRLKESEHYRPVLCGVIALGCLFSRNNDSSDPTASVEQIALSKAQDMLHHPQSVENITADASGVFQVMAWMLRTVYLRCTASPISTWVACCRSANIAHFINLNDEKKWASLNQNSNHLRHLFWSLEIFNTWLSQEIAQPKTPFLSCRCQHPKPTDAMDVAPALVEIYEKTKDIFVVGGIPPEQCYDALYSLMDFKTIHPVISLDHAYLCIVLFRRMRVFNISERTISGLVKIAIQSLSSCEELAMKNQPWWQIINVPFHLLSMVIMIDQPEFTSQIRDIIKSMARVGHQFRTKEVLNTVNIAKELISILKMRKEKEVSALSTGISEADHTLSQDNGNVSFENFDHNLLLGEILMMNELYEV